MLIATMRSRAGVWFVRVLFGLLALSFGLWGVADVLQPPTSRNVATVGDIKIDADAYAQEFDRTVQQLRASFGPDFDAAKARQFGVDRQVLSQIVSRALFDAEARHEHLSVPDPQLVEAIRANPMFQNADGKFERARYDTILRDNNLSEQMFTTMMRGDLTRRQIVTSVGGGISGPEPFARLLYIYRNEQRQVRMFAVPSSAVHDLAKPTEADLRAYYTAHTDMFARPEYRKVSYFIARPADFAAKMEVPDADLQTAYQDRLASFAEPEQRNFDQLLFRDRDQAEAAAAKLRDDGKASVDKAPGLIATTTITAAKRAELLPQIADLVFATAENTVGGPVDSPLGWVVVHVTSIVPAHTKSFEQVRGELREAIATERTTDKFSDIANQIEDERAAGATLGEIAQKFGVPLHTIAALDHSGNTPDGKPATDLPDVPKFLDTVFASDADADLDPIELADGGYALLHIDAIIPATAPPFEQVEDQVRERQQADLREAAMKKLADSLAQRANTGTDLATLARETGQTVQDLGAIMRDYKGEALAPDVVHALFAAKQGAAVSGPVGDSYAVAQVEGIIPADVAAHPEAVKTIQAEIAASISEDVLRQYQTALEARYPVKVNEKAASAALGQPQE